MSVEKGREVSGAHKIGVWNVCDGLDDPNRAEQIAQYLAFSDPDIAVIPEALASGKQVHLAAARVLEANNLHLHTVDYGDHSSPRKDKHQLAVVYRPWALEKEPTARYFLGRATLLLSTNLGYDLAAVHGFDRHFCWKNDPEEARVRQFGLVVSSLSEKAVVAGDFNAMHGDDRVARVLRAFAPVVQYLPSVDPGESCSKLERLGSLSQRLAAMANGRAMQFMLGSGFGDADPKHNHTMAKGPVRVQLDHIMHRSAAGVSGFEVLKHHGLSDHNMVQAKLTF